MSVTSNKVFSLRSFYAAAAHNNDLQLSITGLNSQGLTLYNKTVTLQVFTATEIMLNWIHINTITFVASGGMNNIVCAIVNSTCFAMDNWSIEQ